MRARGRRIYGTLELLNSTQKVRDADKKRLSLLVDAEAGRDTGQLREFAFQPHNGDGGSSREV